MEAKVGRAKNRLPSSTRPMRKGGSEAVCHIREVVSAEEGQCRRGPVRVGVALAGRRHLPAHPHVFLDSHIEYLSGE
jgi:hypothetical protein